MPYYLHSKLEEEPEHGTPYTTASEAHAANDTPATHKITFIPSETERWTWRERETDRFDSGQYVRVPWANNDHHPDHYVHLSTVHAGLVAYTKTEEHGVSDRQTRVRPGKYLEEFYADVFASDVRDRWIQECSAQHMQLSIARTAVDIVRVYRGGPTSCMDKAHEDRGSFNCGADHHPCEVYGNSDLGVAYVGNIDKATARAIIWPDKTLYGRLYGNEHLLRTLLETAGYTSGSMRGAKIRRVMCDDGIVMPYVDGIGSAREDGRWIVLGGGPLDCQITNGVTSEEDNSRNCDHCGSSYEENDDTDPYCQSCYDDSYTCIDCNETYFEDGTGTDNGILCESCYRDRCKTCAIDDCRREWMEEEEFSRTQRRDRQNDGTNELCRRCADHHAFCCDEWYDTNDHSACPQCEPEEEDVTPIAPAVPTVRYIRHATMEFRNAVAYLMLYATGALWAIHHDGSTVQITNNWLRDYQTYLDSGRWQYFTPLPCQIPDSGECEYPVRAHATLPPATVPDDASNETAGVL